jgi:hypothetical protein
MQKIVNYKIIMVVVLTLNFQPIFGKKHKYIFIMWRTCLLLIKGLFDVCLKYDFLNNDECLNNWHTNYQKEYSPSYNVILNITFCPNQTFDMVLRKWGNMIMNSYVVIS